MAYVEAVEGGDVYIEEYNHDGRGHYDSRVVPASTFTGYIHFRDLSAGSAPAPPSQPQTGPISDLGFIKLRNTAGTVEVHWDALGPSGLRRVGDATSDFSPADASNGSWDLFGWDNNAPELGFVKVRNTAGTIEAHWDVLTGGAYHRVGSATSDFSLADATNGVWSLLDASGGVPLLGFVKIWHTGSGSVEVHWDTLRTGKFVRAGDLTSDFSAADASNGVFELFGSVNGAPELGFIKLRNTPSGRVEVHWDTLRSGSYRRAGDYVTDFSSADASNGRWNLTAASSNGVPQLGFVKLANTGSGSIEAHADALSGTVFSRVADYSSDFSTGDASNGLWQIGDF